MQPQGGPPGNQNPFAAMYNVNTTYVPDEVVPAVPPAGPPPGYQAHHQAMPMPGGAPPPHMTLAFTDTTAPQYVTGNISRQEERQHLVFPGGRSDDPGSSSQPGPFSAPAPPLPPGGGGPAPAGGPAPTLTSGPKEDYSKYAFYNIRRYREYFDVDTNDVLWRVGNSLIGLFRPNFIETTMQSPDLYGPFWIATTLIFTVAVSGNFAAWIAVHSIPSPSPPPPPFPPYPPTNGTLPPVPAAATPSPGNDIARQQWFNDYTKLAESAGIFYGYILVIGLALYFCVRWFKGEIKLANVFCIYGYCLSIFIPVSIACVVPIDWLRWLLVMLATALSAGFLFMNFRATIWSAAPARATLVLLIMVLCHVGLGLALKLYFFNY